MNTSPLILAALLAALLGACANPAPPTQWYQLRTAPPVPVSSAVGVPAGQVVQLLMPVSVPELLERDALLVPQGESGLRALEGQRWAEPLRDAVPRVLRQDLATLLGESRVWTAPVPAGVVVTRQLRVEVLTFQISADGSAVNLLARWTISDSTGRMPPVVRTAQIQAPSSSPAPDAWVAAHRLALWRLAEAVAEAVAQPAR